MNSLVTVDFHGDTLFAAERDGDVYVAVKPISNRLGLVWRKQQQRLTRDAILAEGITILVIPSPGGAQETTCLRLDLINGWLFGISENAVKDEDTRQRVLDYKRECYRVLFEHFHPAQAAPPAIDVDDLYRKMLVVAEVRRAYGKRHAQLTCEALGVTEALGLGGRPPAQAAPAPETVVSEEDLLPILVRFLEHCTEPARGSRVSSSELFWLYCGWARENDSPTLNIVSFGKAMTKTGVRRIHSNKRFYLGIRIRQEAWRGKLPQA